jgi:hypothetical protein
LVYTQNDPQNGLSESEILRIVVLAGLRLSRYFPQSYLAFIISNIVGCETLVVKVFNADQLSLMLNFLGLCAAGSVMQSGIIQ